MNEMVKNFTIFSYCKYIAFPKNLSYNVTVWRTLYFNDIFLIFG